MADTDDKEARRRRLVAQAKADAEAIRIEQMQRGYGSASADERAAAMAGRRPASVDEAAEQIRAQETSRDPSTSDRMRARGSRELEAGLKLYGEADRKRTVKVANPDYKGTREYTTTMGAGERAARRGIFSPGAVQYQAQPAQPPVQVVVQAPGSLVPPPPPPAQAQQQPQLPQQALPGPASVLPPEPTMQAPAAPSRMVPPGAVGTVPGELPAGPLPDVPLEGEPPADETPEQELARLEREAMSVDPASLEAQAAADYGGDEAQAGEPWPVEEEPAGVLQRRLDAQEMIARDTVGAATEEAIALRDAATEARAALDEARASQEEQDALLAERLEASEIANRGVADLTAKAREMAAVDPRRAWADAGLARKAGFAIQIALSSFGGRSDPLAALRRYVDESVEAETNALGKVGADIDAARGVSRDRAGLLEQARAVTSDKRTAEDIVRVAKLEQVRSELIARAAAAGVPLTGSEQEALIVGLESDIAELKVGIEARAARNPQYFTKSVGVYGKNARAGMLLAGKKLVEQGVGASELADKQDASVEEIGIKGVQKAMLEQAKQAAKSGDKSADQAYRFGSDTAVMQSVIGQVDALLSQDDIAGYGYTSGINTPGKRDTDAKIRLLLDDIGRFKSGGAITEDEIATFRAMVLDGVEFGDGSILETSEGRLRSNLNNLKASVNLRVKAIERGLQPEVRSYYNRNVMGADFAARWSGDGSPSVVEED
jgi:hypothetical protein